jgi:hypothetical protein
VAPISTTVVVAVILFAIGAKSGAGGSVGLGPELLGLHVSSGGGRFAGDGPLLTTISPNRDGFRDRALVRFSVDRVVTVRMTVNRTTGRLRPIYSHTYRLSSGRHTLVWTPRASREPQTYLVRLVAVDRAPCGRTYRSSRRLQPRGC